MNKGTPNPDFDLPSLSAISQKKSNMDQGIDIKDEKNKKMIDKERLYLDVELNIKADDENSFDEGHFNFDKNTQNLLREAFDTDKTKKRKWQEKFIKMMKDEGIIKEKSEFEALIEKNNLKKILEHGYSDAFKYSFNQHVGEEEEIISNEDNNTTYFTKLLITINLIFRVSYLYKYSYDIGYSKSFNTIFRILTLQLFDFDNQNSLFSIGNSTFQILFFVLVAIWFFSFITFYCLVKSYFIKRTIELENFTIKYDFKEISPIMRIFFNMVVILCLYLYIPIVRDSIMTIFFIVENVSATSTFQIFFQTKDAINIILWIKFFICIVVVIAFFMFPFFLFKLLKNNHPLLNPFDNLNDTLFHSIDCPNNCSGALLDIDKRICWDFIKDNLFFVDLKRPINRHNLQNKVGTILIKYYTDCNTIKSPMMILFKGYSFAYKNYLFWFLIKHYIFLFIVKMPYSTLFKDFAEDNLNKRSLISYSFSITVCLYFIWDNIKHYKSKFNFRHDMVLNLIMNTFILFICLIGILKITIVGNYMFQTVQNSTQQNSILTLLELLSFGSLSICIVTLILFMVYSIPQIRYKIKSRKLNIPYDWLDSNLTHAQIKKGVIDLLWKPFWDSLFKNDILTNKNINLYDTRFIDEHCDGKKIEDEFSFRGLAMNPKNRLNTFKRKTVEIEDNHLNETYIRENNLNKNNELGHDNDESKDILTNENLTKCDILLRKWIQFKLEGADVFWDGDVIGKRTCHNFFGRLIVSEFPFKLIMIYDESNEKVEIPKFEWIHLSKLNLQNDELMRQVKIRNQLRSLNKNRVKYDEFYFEKGEKRGLSIKDVNKNNKEASKNNNIEEIKFGTLHVETLIPDNPFTHGFKIYLEVKDQKQINSNKIKETIIFDTHDICLNVRNFKYSKLNILLIMNDDLIKEEEIFIASQKKEFNRNDKCFKRYINELTLSSLFFNIVYNNGDVSLTEIFKYFLKHEKQTYMKLLPYIHIDGLLKAINLWQLLLTNPMQALWYNFFYQLWTRNKSLLTDLKVGKYFNPDTSHSICYYVFDKDKLKQFINKLDLQNLITKDVIDKLDNRIQDLKENEREKMKKKLIFGQKQGLIELNDGKKSMPESNKKHSSRRNIDEDSSRLPLNISNKGVEINIDEEKLEIYLNKFQQCRDKFIEYVPEYSPVIFSTPSWVYLTFNNEYALLKVNTNEFRQIINEYFISNMKNPDKLFTELGEYAMFLSLYTDSEIFELYDNKDLKCDDPLIAKFTLDKFSEIIPDQKSIRSKVKGKFLTALDWGSKNIEITLPPIFGFIDEKSSKKLDSNYLQKIDDKGRVFYVDKIFNKTSFIHPQMRSREKTRAEKELELLYGVLPNGWEVVNYKNLAGDIKLLYVDHNLKRTSWIDPRKKKLV